MAERASPLTEKPGESPSTPGTIGLTSLAFSAISW